MQKYKYKLIKFLWILYRYNLILYSIRSPLNFEPGPTWVNLLSHHFDSHFYHFHNFPIGWSKISKCWNVTLPHPNFVIPYEIIIWPKFRKNRLIFRGRYQIAVCPMLSLWRIFDVRLRVWKHWPIHFSMPNSDWV